MAPHLEETNLNDTELSFDLSTDDREKKVTLKCIVSGMPKPKVSWYKVNIPIILSKCYFMQKLYKNLIQDDVRVKPDKQFQCFNDYQELVIHYLRETTGGRYTCRAENRIGIVEKHQTIVIINAGTIYHFKKRVVHSENIVYRQNLLTLQGAQHPKHCTYRWRSSYYFLLSLLPIAVSKFIARKYFVNNLWRQD